MAIALPALAFAYLLGRDKGEDSEPQNRRDYRAYMPTNWGRSDTRDRAYKDRVRQPAVSRGNAPALDQLDGGVILNRAVPQAIQDYRQKVRYEATRSSARGGGGPVITNWSSYNSAHAQGIVNPFLSPGSTATQLAGGLISSGGGDGTKVNLIRQKYNMRRYLGFNRRPATHPGLTRISVSDIPAETEFSVPFRYDRNTEVPFRHQAVVARKDKPAKAYLGGYLVPPENFE